MAHDDKIVIFGMSCVGKTTFAKQIRTHNYQCFDAMFPWNEIETLGLSTSGYLKNIQNKKMGDRFVLDGWHLSDAVGKLLPGRVTIYVVYAPYDEIISRYRAPVETHDQHLHMFRKWYSIDFSNFNHVRYWRNDQIFKEESEESYLRFRDEYL